MWSSSYTSHAAFFLCGEFLLYIPCWFHFNAWISLAHPMLFSFLCREFLLHIPCWLLLFLLYLGSVSYTSHAGFILVREFLFNHPVLVLFLCREFVLNIPWYLYLCAGSLSDTSSAFISCWLCFYVGSFSYTSHADFILMRGFLLHIPCCLHFYRGSFSYTPRAGFTLMYGISLTHPMLPPFLCMEFAGSFSYIFQAAFLFMWGVSITYPMLVSFYARNFPIHPELTFLYVGSFSYTSRAGIGWCEQLVSSAVYSEDNPVTNKSWVEAGPGEKCEKIALNPETEVLEQPEQSRTKPNNKWVKCAHRNERGRKEMDLNSKQALAEKATEWIDSSSANYPKDNHTNKIKELGGRRPRKRASKSCNQKRERSPTTP